MTETFDVVVIGAGAAGMMCASVAGQRGRRVLVIDHATALAEKIRISGGGRCNFTNLQAGPANFHSENPHFCRSALARYTPQDFLALLARHGIAWHEKHKGQLFCDDSAQNIIDMLVAECSNGNVAWRQPCKVEALQRENEGWRVDTDAGSVLAQSVVIATGGLSIPKIGATDFGHRIARQFDIPVIAPRPGLVPLTFDAGSAPFAELAGIALEVELTCNAGFFREDLLITHRGLSGPAILQISSYWTPGDALRINLLPDLKVDSELLAAKNGARQHVVSVVAQWLPRRMAELLVERAGLAGRPIAEAGDKALRQLAASINQWELKPSGSEGYRKAEVTLGGVDTRALDQKTMMARSQPGLHFVGEVMDVTGWLGGYNFQWAWASGYAAGMAV
ncbi:MULTISPECIES: NAD(P)/FAD-dependent oxidoreductase [unclassified Uliginosibacterium]|uniref:NAD(P)/FAD-dependent oxidoreductase n=1 Tax=unclassified Uliginosibacterium TaxID=2621521 RepID=UPI000C79A7FD|nr:MULTISPECIES: NAD(P)/FAD-dependent oxidoreductase [unclassified Uliginosibacterium]MDO6386481.1 NAD(P)/FAD-dependent oxidoreductase [Uliginosibacterium sp. 31-12]PLK50322.1 aminoacetone oxidase family FAD-binding enzyme [Uliginosibacterium sp. TH139]